MQLSGAPFKSKPKKLKKIHPPPPPTPLKKKFLYTGKMELSNTNIKKFLIFSEKKGFLIFRETETPKKILMF